jgi:uncharacterized protein
MSSSTAQIEPGAPGLPGLVDPLVARTLAEPRTYGGHAPVEVRETHASRVFLVGDRAFKLKKPVALGFLDYGTLERRHAACREEVRVNSELAAGIYLGVRALVAGPDGLVLAPEDAPKPVEYLVEMRRFDEADTLAGLIGSGALSSVHVRAVARRLADFHRGAAPVAGGDVEDVLALWRANVSELAAVNPGGAPRAERALGFARAFVSAHGQEIERRREAGLVRDGHGDLRCEHVLAAPLDEVRVVDRVEFDPGLRRTDIACDLAFLTMDLEALGQPQAAAGLIAAYRAQGVDPGSPQLLDFYAAHRALVRAKVALIAAREREGERRARSLELSRMSWRLAERLCWRARRPLAVVVCGPAASGKSTLAAELAARSGMPVVSSDLARKAAAGIAPDERAAPEFYSEARSHATYEQVGRAAHRALGEHGAVIVDATCRSRGDRFLVLHRLHGRDLTRLVVRCRVPLAVALGRAARRLAEFARGSDATPAIVAEQHEGFEELTELPPGELLELDAELPLDEQVGMVAAALDRLLAARAREGSRG